jgi:hypothetical protein
MRLRELLIICVSVLLIAGISPRDGWGQANFEITTEEPTYTFGESLSFRAVVKSFEDLDEVVVIIQPGEEEDLQVYPVSLDSSGKLSVDIDLRNSPLPGFTNIRYWFQVTSSDDEVIQSPVYTFFYADNRNQWETLTGEQISVYWYAGDLAFGEESLNVAQAAAREVEELLDVFIPETVEVYIYDDAGVMQVAVPGSGQYWIAGHADPVDGAILVTLPPGPDQRLEMERQIPHEMMHVALNYTDSNAYSNLPVWFNEGLASLAELYTNPEYKELLENAFENGELIPMSDLCASFPGDAQQALLAYAQSASFTEYLYENYGKSGVHKMMAAYASGLSCEHGIAEALEMNIQSLEEGWQSSTFAGVTFWIALREMLPWLLLLLVLLAVPLVMVGVIMKKRPVRRDYE